MGLHATDWERIAAQIAQIGAPVLGGLLGGPAGAAVGEAVARAVGAAATPDAVAQAIAADPTAAEKIRALELQNQFSLHALRISSETARVVAVNQTMQAEAASSSLWDKWRGAWGWISAVAFAVQIGALAWVMVGQGMTAAVTAVSSLSGVMFTLWSVPGAILGVTAWHTGQSERERIKNAGFRSSVTS